MSWKTDRVYEARVIRDALARLAERMDFKSVPFSDEELQTLAKRARESFRAFRSVEKRERLNKYKAHLASLYGDACVASVWTALEKINNEIGYEEK